MNAETLEYFKSQRREIQERGFITDDLLGKDPDCPVFGINLACAYPFPESIAAPCVSLARQLGNLDDGVYVYPIWETHITLVTFLNFSLFQRPSSEKLGELRSWIEPISATLHALFKREPVKPFQIEFQPPVLLRKAVILPVTNPTGEIARLRQRVRQAFESDKTMHEKLLLHGFNVPGIIHSTIMRFTQAPRDVPRFVSEFDAIAAATTPFTITVREMLLTLETKPYMREGQTLNRFI